MEAVFFVVEYKAMPKVKIWISRLDTEKTAKIMRILFAKKPYIKVFVENSDCILDCHEVGDDPVSYIVEYLSDKKKFMGKFYSDLVNNEKLERYQMPICRFGWWDACLLPEGLQELQFNIQRFHNLQAGMLLHEADIDAQNKTGYIMTNTDKTKKRMYESYVGDIVKYKGKSREEAESILDPFFPDWKNMPNFDLSPKILSPEQVAKSAERELKFLNDLIGNLQFMSPKMRKKHLDKNLLDALRINGLLKRNGREWIVNTIGEIPGYTDI